MAGPSNEVSVESLRKPHLMPARLLDQECTKCSNITIPIMDEQQCVGYSNVCL